MQTVQTTFVDTLRVGDSISLIGGEQPSLSLFEATILRMINGGIVISEPVCVEGDLKLRSGLAVHLQLSRSGTITQYESIIKNISWESSNSVLLEPPRNMKSVQRRDFVRLSFKRVISFAPIPKVICWRDWQDEIVWNEAYTSNLSGSGLLLECEVAVAEGDLILLRLPFFDDINISHPVLAVCRRAGNREEKLPIGLEFILGRSLGEYLRPEDIAMVPRSAAKFDILEQVKLSHFVLDHEIRQRREEEE